MESQFQNGLKASHRRKPMSRKELKIIAIATLYCVSGFRRNYNNRLLKLALENEKPGWPGMKAQPGLILIIVQPGETGLITRTS